MEEGFDEVDERHFGWKKLILLFVLVVFLWTIWSVFFSYDKCTDKVCFDDGLRNCDKAKYIGGDEMIFEYYISGKKGDSCEVEVKLLQGELNNADSKVLEGQVMTCMLPLGVVMSPESDISLCHGLLKEGLQDLVIRKLHTYLVQNLGRLNLEVAGLPNA